MTNEPGVPPERKLPDDRRDEIKRFLMSEASRTDPPMTMRRSSRGMPRQRIITLAAVAILVAAAGALAFRGSTDVASAAQIQAKIADSLHLNVSVTGEFVVRTQNPGPRPSGVKASSNAPRSIPPASTFVVGSDGSYLSVVSGSDTSIGRSVAYDASTGVETSVVPVAAGQLLYIRAKNLDPALVAQYPHEAQLGAWVQGALVQGEPGVDETTYEGRSAWILTTTFTPEENAYDIYGARVDVVVDQETGLVLQITQYAYDRERWSSEASVRDLRVGEPTNAVPFTAPRPADADDIAHDYGFQRLPVRSASELLGYQPLLPTNTLGRSLVDFAIAKATSYPFPGLPPRRLVASARYGRGADAITVTTHRGTSADLPTLLPGVTSETVELEDGPFAGGDAYVGSSPLGRAGVAAFADGLLLQVTAPSITEALKIANSLRPQ